MFGKRIKRELEAPPVASQNEQSVEVLRVWAAPGHAQEAVLKTLGRTPELGASCSPILPDTPRTRTKVRAMTGSQYWHEYVNCSTRSSLTLPMSPHRFNRLDFYAAGAEKGSLAADQR
jgi:hypothetical protein